MRKRDRDRESKRQERKKGQLKIKASICNGSVLKPGIAHGSAWAYRRESQSVTEGPN